MAGLGGTKAGEASPRPVSVIGIAAVPCGRLMAKPEDPIQVLEHEVLSDCLLRAVADAGIDKTAIDAMVYAHPRTYTRQLYFSTFMAHYLQLPLDGVLVEVIGNGMTGGLAFDQAVDRVATGRAEVAVALGVNFEFAAETSVHLDMTMRAIGDVDFQTPSGFTPLSWYAMDAMRYMHDFGATRAEIAAVAVKNRRHAALNPLAQFTKPIDIAEVLAQRTIAEPLGLFDVPPRSEGAACVIVASADFARTLGKDQVRVKSRGFHHEGAHQVTETPGDMTAFVAAQRASHVAYEAAGIAAGDIDFAEIYAPCTIVEVLVAEACGLVPRGEGARRTAEGETALGGRIPICTSGGLQSRGHPPRVTPLYNVVELVEQLRHDAGARQVKDARLGLVSCELGNYNAALIHILEAVQ